MSINGRGEMCGDGEARHSFGPGCGVGCSISWICRQLRMGKSTGLKTRHYNAFLRA